MDTTVRNGHSLVHENQESCTCQCKVFQEPMPAVKREKEGKKGERESERVGGKEGGIEREIGTKKEKVFPYLC